MFDSVTVLIPTKNRVKVLQTLVKELSNSEFVKEILILNTSDVPLKINLFKSHKVKIHNLPNHDLLKAKNYVSQFITTKWTLVLDDDIRIKATVVDDFVKNSKKYKFDIASGILEEASRYSLIDPIKFVVYGKYSFYGVPSLNTKNTPRASRYNAQVVPGGFMFIKSLLFHKINYDVNYYPPYFNEDSDFQLQAVKSGSKMVIFTSIIATHLKLPSGGMRSFSSKDRAWWYSFGFNNVYFRVKNFGIFKLLLYFIFRPQDFVFVLKQRNLVFLYNFFLGQINGYKKAKKNRG